MQVDTGSTMNGRRFDNTEAIAAENGKGAELSLENATSGMTAPFHAGAAKYFAEKGIVVDTE